jgi:hypothetical protein
MEFKTRRTKPGEAIVERRIPMAPRMILVALLLAFGIASAAATITTIRQVETATYAPPQPVTRI